MNINVARNGQQLGVFPLDEINRRLASGTLVPSDLAWHEGMSGWQPLHTIAGVYVPAGTAMAPMAPPPGAYPGAAAYGAPPPPNYLVQSILVTLFCCMPLGIVAIIFAAQVDGKARAGDLVGAQEASAQAKRWSTIGAFSFLGIMVIYFILFALGIATGNFNWSP